MLIVIDKILRAMLIIIGILGYCFKNPDRFVAGRKMLTSLIVFYLLLAIYMFFHALSNHVQSEYIFLVAVIFELFIAVILIIGLRQLFRVWEFELESIKRILLYMSIIYLLGKTKPFGDLSDKVLTELTILPVVVSVAVVIFTLLAMFKIRRMDTFIVFDRLEIVSISYMIAALVGLCCIGRGVAFVSCLLLVILDFYALFVVIVFVKPMMYSDI